MRNVKLKKITKGVEVKPAKLIDVLRLLELYYSAKWIKNLKLHYYAEVFKTHSIRNEIRVVEENSREHKEPK